MMAVNAPRLWRWVHGNTEVFARRLVSPASELLAGLLLMALCAHLAAYHSVQGKR